MQVCFCQQGLFISSFLSCLGEEVCVELLAKGYLPIRDAKELDAPAYSVFMTALVVLRKRI
jgi:hypothetical protein